MTGRMEFDLGVVRRNKLIPAYDFRSFYVGDCTGSITIQFNNPSGSIFDPNEFNKVTDIYDVNYLCLNNSAQPGKILVLYVTEKRSLLEVLRWQ